MPGRREFTAVALTDLTPFLCSAEPQVPGGTLASRGGRRPRRGGPLHRGVQWRRGGKPGPFGKLTG
jgi:hypothetical protein